MKKEKGSYPQGHSPQSTTNTVQFLGEKEHLIAIINSIPDEIWFTDCNNKFTLINSSGVKAFKLDLENGVSVESLASSLEVLRADGSQRPLSEAPPLRALQGEIVCCLDEIVKIPSTGTFRYRQVSASPIKNQDGEITGAVSVVRDVIEQKTAESKLAELYSTICAVYESLNSPIFSIDRHYCYTSFNTAHASVMNALYGVDIKLGNNMLAYMSVEIDRTLAKKNLDKALAGERFVDSAFSGAEGRSRLFFEIIHNPVKSSRNEVVGVSVFARNITEKKQSELALEESEAHFKRLVATVPGMFFDYTVTHDGINQFTYVSLQCKDMFDMDPETLMTDSGCFWRMILDANGKNFRKEDLLSKESGALLNTECLIMTPSGKQKWIHITSRQTPSKDKGTAVWSGIMLDISDRKRSEKERAVLKEQLHHSEKLRSIGQLAGGIAHDFNNSLGGIMGYAELLRVFLAQNPDHKKQADKIVEICVRTGTLTRQLLSYARLGKTEDVLLNLNGLVSDTIDILKQTLGVETSIIEEFAANVPCIVGDSALITNSLINIAINARDAMPQGGTITFKTEVVELQEDSLVQHGFMVVQGMYIVLSIKDTGTGMEKAVLDHIFEPFFTTKENGKGTGLGLPSVYGSMKQHDGYITVDTEIGSGSVFKLYFPIQKQTARQVQNNGVIQKNPDVHNYDQTKSNSCH